MYVGEIKTVEFSYNKMNKSVNKSMYVDEIKNVQFSYNKMNKA